MATLRRLEIFLAVARIEHMTRAARELGITQGAASQAVGELEAELGVPLFERVGRGIRLTDAGRLLQREAMPLVERVDSLLDLVRGASGVLRGRLRVGASTTIGNYLLPARIALFVSAFPETEIELSVANTAEIVDQLISGALDMGFVEGRLVGEGVDAEAWLEDSLEVFAAPDHALAQQTEVDLSSLAHARWIVREAGSGTGHETELAFLEQGVRIRPALRFGNTEAIKRAVIAGAGVACLSRHAIVLEVAAGLVTVLRVPSVSLRRTLWIVTRQGSVDTPLRRAFREHVYGGAPVLAHGRLDI